MYMYMYIGGKGMQQYVRALALDPPSLINIPLATAPALYT